MGWDDEVDERSGGLLMAYTGKVTDAFFQDGEYGCQLNLHILLDHPEDHPNIPDGIVKNWYGTGPGWVAVQNGTAVESAEATKFNGNTECGRLVKQIQAIDPDGATLAAGTTKQAAFYKALSGDWGPVEWKTNAFTGRDGQPVEAKVKAKTMPTKLASTNGRAPAGFDIGSLGATPEQLTILQTAANSTGSAVKFQEALIPQLGSLGAVGGEAMKHAAEVYSVLAPM